MVALVKPRIRDVAHGPKVVLRVLPYLARLVGVYVPRQQVVLSEDARPLVDLVSAALVVVLVPMGTPVAL